MTTKISTRTSDEREGRVSRTDLSPAPGLAGYTPGSAPGYAPGPTTTTNLADILERVLDKGIVIAGDIKIDLLDIELLTIRLRLFISSVETARKAGIDWWETDPALSSRAARAESENQELRDCVARLEQLVGGSDRGPERRRVQRRATITRERP